MPGIHRLRRGPPIRWGSPISCAQLPAVRRLISSSRQMSVYGTPAKWRSQNNCLIASDFMPKVSVVRRVALIVALKIAAMEFLCRRMRAALPGARRNSEAQEVFRLGRSISFHLGKL